jgi:nucleotide-binding universal stress UspA family protein
LALGTGLAQALGAPLIIACVYPSAATISPVPPAEMRAEAERTARAACKELPAALEPEAYSVAGGSPAHGLHDLAEERAAVAIVVGSSHRGALGRVLAGTGAGQLLSGSPCSVALAPRGLAQRAPLALRRIAVGFDDSTESWNALGHATTIAAATGASVRVVHALPPLTVSPAAPLSPIDAELERRRAGERAAERAVASLPETVRPDSRLVTGEPVSVLETEARDGIDLLVLGSRGFGPVRRVLLGSVSSELMRQAPCPVMVVPRSVEGAAAVGGIAAREQAAPG